MVINRISVRDMPGAGGTDAGRRSPRVVGSEKTEVQLKNLEILFDRFVALAAVRRDIGNVGACHARKGTDFLGTPASSQYLVGSVVLRNAYGAGPE